MQAALSLQQQLAGHLAAANLLRQQQQVNQVHLLDVVSKLPPTLACELSACVQAALRAHAPRGKLCGSSLAPVPALGLPRLPALGPLLGGDGGDVMRLMSSLLAGDLALHSDPPITGSSERASGEAKARHQQPPAGVPNGIPSEALRELLAAVGGEELGEELEVPERPQRRQEQEQQQQPHQQA